MIINDFKILFTNTLSSLYPLQEIQSFYFLLMERHLDLSRVNLALNPNKKIDPDKEQVLLLALAKLKEEYPIQYILENTEFYGLVFTVDKHVLIPRPETEELVEWVIQDIKEKRNEKKNLSILDIGTGSGCIAISLSKNLPDSKVWALDISVKALEIAKKNAKSNNVNIEFLNGNILEINKLPIKNDLIISNPPYVRELEKKQMKNNVLKHEPELALYVKDEDPLLFYNKIADLAKTSLKSKGKLYFEINQDQGKAVKVLLSKKGFKNIIIKTDLFGSDRMIRAEIN